VTRIQYVIHRYADDMRGWSAPRLGWTSISDIGEVFDGVRLTAAEYVVEENRYVSAATRFIREAGVDRLRIVNQFESGDPADRIELIRTSPAAMLWAEGDEVDLIGAVDVLRLMLRDQVSCALAADGLVVYTGSDTYYLHVESARPCPESVRWTVEHGLYVDVSTVEGWLPRGITSPGSDTAG
jgi:hypothetical protein